MSNADRLLLTMSRPNDALMYNAQPTADRAGLRGEVLTAPDNARVRPPARPRMSTRGYQPRHARAPSRVRHLPALRAANAASGHAPSRDRCLRSARASSSERCPHRRACRVSPARWRVESGESG